MSKIFIVFVLAIGFAMAVGNEVVRDFASWVWMGFWGLFIVFLIVYYQIDHKRMNKKRKENQEG